jgi:hypothetical protein
MRGGEEHKSRVERSLLAWLLVPIAVLLSMLSWGFFGHRQIVISLVGKDKFADVPILEAAARYNFVAVTLLFISVGIILMIASYLLTSHVVRDERRAIIYVWLLLTIVCSTGVLAFGVPSLHEFAGRTLFNRSILSGTYADGKAALVYQIGISTVNICAVGSAAAVALAAAAALATPPKAIGPAEKVFFYSERARQLTNLLYGSAVLLVLGAAHTRSWLSWPMPFIEDTDNQRKNFEALVSAFVAVQGVFYSLILASVFVGPLAILRHRAVILARSEALRKMNADHGETQSHQAPVKRGSEDPRMRIDEWLREQGWSHWRWETIFQQFAILAPLIVPALHDTIQKVMPKSF